MIQRVLANPLMWLAISVTILAGCGSRQAEPRPVETTSNVAPEATPTPVPTATPVKLPDLQAELKSERDRTPTGPLASVDFLNFEYPLPRGWQDSDGKEVLLTDGERPMEKKDDVERIGLSHVVTKFFDVTGDGQAEAIIVLKIKTGGSAVPQIVYLFTAKDGKPDLIWYFRTGDRADGGLKNLYSDNGLLVVELFGQDRFLLGEVETGRITGDVEQLCCPTFWTRSKYKWTGSVFRMDGKRLTFSVQNPDAAPLENMVEQAEREQSGKK